MITNNTSLSFGGYLQTIRLEKGISLEDVSKETRIRVDNLLLIEEEDHAKLPAPIFVKGFLRAYARVIGADEKEAVRRYENRYHTYQKIVSPEVHLSRLGAGVWSNFRLALGVIFCLMVISIYALSTLDEKSSRRASVGYPRVHKEESSGVPAAEPGHTAIPQASTSTEEKEKKLLLKVITVKETWIKVIVDGQQPETFNLSAGDRLEFEAFSGFNILLGDATAVNLILNNQSYPVEGDVGEAVNIQIP